MALSKEAGLFWDDKKGPLENLFHLVEIGAVALPGVGTGLKILVFFSSLFGLGFAELGRYLDESLELTSIHDINKFSPREASTKVTADLFDVTESVLAREAFLYAANMKKFAKLEAEHSTMPVSLKKEAFVGGLLKKLFKKKVKGKGGPGFIGLFFSKLTGLLSWAWTALKAVIMGGLGVLALKGTDMLHEDSGKGKVREEGESAGFKEDLDRGIIDISIKDSVNPYRVKLEERIDDIMGR